MRTKRGVSTCFIVDGTPFEDSKYIQFADTPTTIGDRDYSGHALDQMQGRGVPPSVVEDTIQNGQQSPDPIPGRTRNYSPDNNVTVVTESDGKVVTVIPGRR